MPDHKKQFEHVMRSEKDRITSRHKARFVEPPFISQVGLFLTYRCTIKCSHCMVCAGPERTEEMELGEAMDWLHQIAAYENGHIKSIGFTGGEPFYSRNKLFSLAQASRKLGLTYTVATNAYWASSKNKAIELLSELQPSDISISADIYHEVHIPLNRVENAYQACEHLGIGCDITLAYSRSSMDVTRSLVQRLLQFAPSNAIRTTGVFPSGRGEHQADFSDGSPRKEPPSDIPCLFATVPYILPNGDVIPCIGPMINITRDKNPLYLGSLRENKLAYILDNSKKNPVLHGLRIWGPKFWHMLIDEHNKKANPINNYYTNCPCEACVTLLSDKNTREFLYLASQSENLASYIKSARHNLLREAY